jgi:hypothetical protein
MRSRGRTLAVLVAAALAACQGGQWSYDRPRTTPAQLDRDMNECRKRAVPRGPLSYPALTGMDRDAFNACMEGRGYTVTRQ